MLTGQLALLMSSLFASAAFYINFAEQPARMGLDDGALLAEWKMAYKRGFVIQAPLAVLGFVLGIIAWYGTGRPLFLAGALLMVANWPWTLVVMMPVNKRLMASPLEAAGADSRALISKWNHLHAVRTVLGALAVLAFFLALVR